MKFQPTKLQKASNLVNRKTGTFLTILSSYMLICHVLFCFFKKKPIMYLQSIANYIPMYLRHIC